MNNLLDDFDEVEVKIKIRPSTMDYAVDIGMVKANLLYSVLKDIIRTMDDGTFFDGEQINVYKDPDLT